jgi:membrane protein CcdC involved in cytochrome C biogenesis
VVAVVVDVTLTPEVLVVDQEDHMQVPEMVKDLMLPPTLYKTLDQVAVVVPIIMVLVMQILEVMVVPVLFSSHTILYDPTK